MATKFMANSFIDSHINKSTWNTKHGNAAHKDLSTVCRTYNEAPYNSIVMQNHLRSSLKRFGAP